MLAALLLNIPGPLPAEDLTKVTIPIGKQADKERIRQERIELGIIQPDKVAEKAPESVQGPKKVEITIPVKADGSVDKRAAQEVARLAAESLEAEEAEVIMLIIANLLDDCNG